MVLIIGGAYQGKTAYAQTKYALRDAEIFTCEGEALDLDRPLASGIWSASRLPASGRERSLRLCWPGLRSAGKY